MYFAEGSSWGLCFAYRVNTQKHLEFSKENVRPYRNAFGYDPGMSDLTYGLKTLFLFIESHCFYTSKKAKTSNFQKKNNNNE